MKCPYCNFEMEKGFVQCRDGVYWTPKKQWVSALSSMAKGAVAIGMDDKMMPKSRAEAYHCEKCKTVIIPYGEDSEK